MEDWQTLLWCCRVGQELSSLPPCCFPSPIQWCKGKGEVKCHLPLPHWWPVWVKSSHWYQGRVELCITMLVQSCSCQVGVEVQIHNKPCWHNGDGKMMCLIALIHLTLLSFFDRVGKKSQFPTSSTVCVCVCREGETSQRLPCYVSSLLSRSGGSQSNLILTGEGYWVLQKPPVREIGSSLASRRQEDWWEAQLSNWLTETSGEGMQFHHWCWLRLGGCCQKVFMLFEWGLVAKNRLFLEFSLPMPFWWFYITD